VYAVAWAAYLFGIVEHGRRPLEDDPRAASARSSRGSPSAIGRRELLRGATLAGATVAAGAAAKLLSGSPTAATLAATGAGASRLAPTTSPAPTGDGSGGSGGSQGSTASRGGQGVSGTPVASLSSIPVGGAIGFQAPGGTPAALVRLSGNEVVAYSRVCTHAGCLVGYDQNQRILYCPCHGAEYDPAHGAEVIGGPAPRPLPEIPVQIDRATGQVVVRD
jgi:thiosulfate dehydrogenase [quinone] large subunit